MLINEIFYSLQGEGMLTGMPSVFIRFAGCPLRCKWCDTKYAWDNRAGEELSMETIVARRLKYKSPFVVITGGEPMINGGLSELTGRLKSRGDHITIETAGIAFIPGLSCDLMSISPKLSNSVPGDSSLAVIHERSRLDKAVLGELIERYEYQLKFVIDSGEDLAEIKDLLSDLGGVDPHKVMLMPQAETREQLIKKSPLVAEMCRESGFAFCQRLQILLWDGHKGPDGQRGR